MSLCLYSCLSYPARKRTFSAPYYTALSAVSCLALSYFFTLSHKQHGFRGKKLLNTKCLYWFSLQFASERLLFRRRIRRDITINVRKSSYKVPLILVRFWSNLNFLDRFSRKPQISNFMKIRSVIAEFFHADTHDDANSRLPQFCARA
jgi:hypothetical protein